MNRFQRAVKSAAPSPKGGQMTHMLSLALGEVPDDDMGLELARELSEDFLEAAVAAYFALRDLKAEGGLEDCELVESVDAPLIRHYFVFEVLADDELPDCYSLEDIGQLTGDGPFVGSFGPTFSRRVTPGEMAIGLAGAGSEPGFFRLDGEAE